MRQTKPIYLQCKLAEGRIKIFHVVRLRGTKTDMVLGPEAEGSVAQMIFGQQG